MNAAATTQATATEAEPCGPTHQVSRPPWCLTQSTKYWAPEKSLPASRIALSHSNYPLEPSAEETWELKLPVTTPQRVRPLLACIIRARDAEGALTCLSLPAMCGSPWERQGPAGHPGCTLLPAPLPLHRVNVPVKVSSYNPDHDLAPTSIPLRPILGLPLWSPSIPTPECCVSKHDSVF